MIPRVLFYFIFLLYAVNCHANTANKPQPDQLSWLTGCWKDTGLGGEVEECWLRAPDGVFTGVFQLVKDGQQQFSEIVMIAEFDGTLGMRVKHFDAGFEQWESDNGVGPTFPYVEMGEHYIQFDGLRYELIDGVLHTTLDMKQGNEIHQAKFIFSRNQATK